ncbi:MAG: ABC transporter permease [Actinomycetota bacterium]
MTTTATNPDLGEEFRSDGGVISRLQLLLHRYPYLSPLTVLIVAMAIFTLLNERFILATNLSLMSQQAVIVGTLAIAQTLIILTAGIDLSIGAIMVFGQMVMANLAVSASASNVQFAWGWPWWAALAAGVLIAVLAGAFNGYLITQFRLPPFIVTLGTLSVFTALSLIIFKARTIQGPELPAGLKAMGEATSVGPFRLMAGVGMMLVLYALFAYILRSTAWGTHVYAVGDDREAAELSGINTRRVLFGVYAVAGLIIGIAGWITIGRVGSASPNVAPNINLDTITAVVIGGTSLFGGRGTMIGTLLGALIVVVVENGLALAGLDQAYRVLAVGLLVIAAVALDQWIREVQA